MRENQNKEGRSGDFFVNKFPEPFKKLLCRFLLVLFFPVKEKYRTPKV